MCEVVQRIKFWSALAHKVLYNHFSGATEKNHEDHTPQQIVKPITSCIQSIRVLASTS